MLYVNVHNLDTESRHLLLYVNGWMMEAIKQCHTLQDIRTKLFSFLPLMFQNIQQNTPNVV